ncbi:MAG: hypothetical protein IPF66_04905 [Holophagales bacterium]|nr:hypothetical protein [Holophagales bacterium]
MSSAGDLGRTHESTFGTVAIAPRGETRPRPGVGTGRVVLRVAGVSGGASYDRGGDPDGWRPASLGLSVATGDRLYAGRGARLELRSAGLEIHLEAGAGLEAIDLTHEVKRFYVWGGEASFLVGRLLPEESFGVDTPNASLTVERAGEYRIEVGRADDTRVVVGEGSAWVSAAGVAMPLGAGDVVRVAGIRCPVHDAPTGPSPESGELQDARLPHQTRDRVLLFRPRQCH